MGYKATAISLWIAFAIMILPLAIFPKLLITNLNWGYLPVAMAFFASAIMFTLRAEDERHAQGHSGLGPVGILAIVLTLSAVIVVPMIGRLLTSGMPSL